MRRRVRTVLSAVAFSASRAILKHFFCTKDQFPLSGEAQSRHSISMCAEVLFSE